MRHHSSVSVDCRLGQVQRHPEQALDTVSLVRYAANMENIPMRTITTLCVFCGSSVGIREHYAKATVQLAHQMIMRNIDLVYGGGGVGLMGILAKTLHESPVAVTGIIPIRLYEMVQHVDHHEDELVIVQTMHERKSAMYERSDAFLALPGGIGTLDELMEALTWLQLGYHAKPVGILNTAGFFDPLIEMLNQMVTEGFLRSELLQALVVDSDPSILLDRLAAIPLNIPQKVAKHRKTHLDS